MNEENIPEDVKITLKRKARFLVEVSTDGHIPRGAEENQYKHLLNMWVKENEDKTLEDKSDY